MNFRNLLDLGSDDILDMTEKYQMEQRRKEIEESSQENFWFEDFDGHTTLFENFEGKEKNNRGFNLSEYGLPIVNGHQGFSYNKSYRIPFERYLEVFGPSFSFHMYLQHSLRSWGGNCFGMAAVAILAYLKKINFGAYQKEGFPLTDTAYDRIVSNGFGSYCCLEESSELTKLIERYCILQFSDHVMELRQKSVPITEREPERIQRFFNDVYLDKIPYMFLVCWIVQGQLAGHAMVVDSIRTPDDLGNGWHRIYLYDPNNPYHTFSEQTPAYYYKQAENRYIDVNVVTGDWHMNVAVNADGNSYSKWDLIGSDKGSNNAFISFIDCESFQSNFAEKARIHPSYGKGIQMLRYRTDFISVCDLNGNKLCTVVNGVLTDCKDERIYNLPVIGTTADGIDNENFGTLILPDEPIMIKSSNGFVGLFSLDIYAGCVSEDAITVCFGDEGSMQISSDAPTMVNVVVKAGEREHFVSYMTDINVSEEPCKVALQGMSLYIDTDNDQKIEVSIITESGISEEKNISALNGALIKGRDQSRIYKKKDAEVSK